DIMAVEALKLCKVETRRRAPDLRQVKGHDHFLRAENLLVTMRPTEPDEVVPHRGGQIPHRTIGIDTERAVTLGKLGTVRPMNERNVRHDPHPPAARLLDLRL